MYDTEQMYCVVRFYAQDRGSAMTWVVKQGLTLEEATLHCNDPETSSRTARSTDAVLHTMAHGAWFDGRRPQERLYTDEELAEQKAWMSPSVRDWCNTLSDEEACHG